MTLKISKQRLLIVEGRDEEQFFDAAMKYLGIASVQILGIRTECWKLSACGRCEQIVNGHVLRLFSLV
jgi:hypothetical protein